MLATSFLLNTLLGNPLPASDALAQVAANPLTLLGMAIVGIITGPLSEELGWRGFALDVLQKRGSLLVSSLVVAPFWWAWHLPLFFMKGTTHSSWGVGTPDFWLFLLAILPLSVLHAWVYDRNRRSILAAVLLHFAYNLSLTLVYPIFVTVKLLQAILLVVVATGMVLTDGSRRRSGSGVKKGQL